MLFNSLAFAVFFPLVSAVYFVLPRVWQVRWLLIASCAFYMAFIPSYILILLLTITIDYIAGLLMGRVHQRARTLVLWGSVTATCLVLFFFKYFDFLVGNVVGLAELLGWHIPPQHLGLILPIGLSFHTFQSLSYVIEVYHRRQAPESNFVVYATYVMFFPQLVAGPIERPQNLLRQFGVAHEFNYDNVAAGLKRMAWGFFKKLVVADRLALYVNDVYTDPRQSNGLQLTLATFFFAYQIYCDFSGYSDIAIGSARVLGFRLMENFQTPYASTSIAEFWRRWHISLSTWFKDYVYVPLGGSRVQPKWRIVNVLVTFGVSGLWHGANWTYICWGLLNGLYLIVGVYTKPYRDRLWRRIGLGPEVWLRRVIMRVTTFALVCVTWVVFRSASMSDAFYVLTHLSQNWDFTEIRTPQFLLRQLPVAIAAIAVLEIGQRWQLSLGDRGSARDFIARFPSPMRWAAYTVFVLLVLTFGVYRQTQFIYFQF